MVKRIMTFVLIYFCFNAFGNNKLLLNSIKKEPLNILKLLKIFGSMLRLDIKKKKTPRAN